RPPPYADHAPYGSRLGARAARPPCSRRPPVRPPCSPCPSRHTTDYGRTAGGLGGPHPPSGPLRHRHRRAGAAELGAPTRRLAPHAPSGPDAVHHPRRGRHSLASRAYPRWLRLDGIPGRLAAHPLPATIPVAILLRIRPSPGRREPPCQPNSPPTNREPSARVVAARRIRRRPAARPLQGSLLRLPCD